MRRTNGGVRVGGAWLAIASSLMIAGLALHGPIAPDLSDQMIKIASHPTVWFVAHWITAAGLSLLMVAGLIVLTSGSRLTEGWWTTTAWAVLPVASLWTLTTAVAEATVVTNAAVSGNTEMFEAWWAFAEGKATGVAFLALAVALIAASDAQSARGATPAWSGWMAMGAGLASFTGWVSGMWFDIRLGSLLWVASTILMSAWTVWFGLALTRSPAGAIPTADAA
jgi:hypothetical protein